MPKALSQARTFEWFKRSKNGRESVEDGKHSGRPSTCTTPKIMAKVRAVILEDRRQTIRDVCNRVYTILRLLMMDGKSVRIM